MTHIISIIFTIIIISSSPAPIMAQTDTNTLPVIQRTAQSTNQASLVSLGDFMPSARHFLTALLIIAILVTSFVLLWFVIKFSFAAMGRNPLNSPNIKRSMYTSFLIISLITGMALMVAYFIAKSGPQELTQAAPTPTPPLPDLPPFESYTHHTTSCFTVAVPFITSYPKLDNTPNRCKLTFVIDEPFKGEFTLTYDRYPQHELENDPSVILRRRNTHIYQPITVNHPAYPRTVSFQSEDEVTTFLIDPSDGQYILSFHTLSPSFEQYLSPPIINAVIGTIRLSTNPAIVTFPARSATDAAQLN
jgi:hypothetical protein